MSAADCTEPKERACVCVWRWSRCVEACHSLAGSHRYCLCAFSLVRVVYQLFLFFHVHFLFVFYSFKKTPAVCLLQACVNTDRFYFIQVVVCHYSLAHFYLHCVLLACASAGAGAAEFISSTQKSKVEGRAKQQLQRCQQPALADIRVHWRHQKSPVEQSPSQILSLFSGNDHPK